jgi:hypothetical protein
MVLSLYSKFQLSRCRNVKKIGNRRTDGRTDGRTDRGTISIEHIFFKNVLLKRNVATINLDVECLVLLLSPSRSIPSSCPFLCPLLLSKPHSLLTSPTCFPSRITGPTRVLPWCVCACVREGMGSLRVCSCVWRSEWLSGVNCLCLADFILSTLHICSASRLVPNPGAEN